MQRWQFGEAEARRITAPVLSLVGGESDPAFSEIEQLLREWFPDLETALGPCASGQEDRQGVPGTAMIRSYRG